MRIPKLFSKNLLAFTLLVVSALHMTLSIAEELKSDADGISNRIVGEARLTKLFWTIYDSRLYTSNGIYRGIEPDLVLEITYQRKIKKEQLIKSTRSEWQALSLYEKSTSEGWLSELSAIWPDVSKGDILRLQVDYELGSHFYFNGKAIGTMKEPAFTRHFLAIWLSPDSSYPELQKQLTGEKKSM